MPPPPADRLSNPLLDFDKLVFIKRHRAIYQHMCDQFYGICQNPGGGLYVLENAFSENPTVRDVLAKSVCETGRLRGERLSGGGVAPPALRYDGQKAVSGDDAEGGSFLSPRLSPDGRQIAFAYVERKGRGAGLSRRPERGHWDRRALLSPVQSERRRQRPGATHRRHVERVRAVLAAQRPDGVHQRARGGYLRCGRACPLYTLYDMAADGSDINCLSFHDSNEWNPSVAHDGRIVWTRWDYVDRHGCIAHMPWILTLDGRDPRPLHGNYAPRQGPARHGAVRAGDSRLAEVRGHRRAAPWPGVRLADHHQPAKPWTTTAWGPVRRFTPEVGFPESQGGRRPTARPGR